MKIDQSVNQSTNPQVNSSLGSLVNGLILLTLAGCDIPASTTSNLPPSSSLDEHASKTIDVGVVLSDREGYLCLPFRRIGLPSDAKVETVKSSCDCVQPSVSDYFTPNGNSAPSILLQFAKEPTEAGESSGTTTRPIAADLGVVVDIKLIDETTHQFTVNMLHTSPATKTLH